MSIYSPVFERARAKIAAKGAPVTFPGAIAGTAGVFDPLTETWSGGTPATDAASVAVQDEGDPDTYRALSLIQSNPVTLMISAPPLTAVAVTLSPGMLLVWAGKTYTIRTSDPFGPDGVPGYFTVVASA